jgi:hypothetical protein
VIPQETVHAARRLAHDVGKYVRFGAPDVRERDPEELRARLRRDLLSTRNGADGSASALQVFAEWKSEEGEALLLAPELSPLAADVERAVDALAALLPALETADRAGLEALDDAALALSRAARALGRAAAAPGRSA